MDEMLEPCRAMMQAMTGGDADLADRAPTG
jgi:hypothetical protein